jgi:hypothetical protein
MVASAQEIATPKAEVGLNYSYTRVNPGYGVPSYNANGGFGDAAYNINKNFGVVAELGANYTGTANGVSLNQTRFEYLFGPRFNLRHSRYNPYVQALFGGQRFSNGGPNNFALAVGGGLNVVVNDHLALRPFQVDYFGSRFTPAGSSYMENDLRYAAGVVLRFGSK